MSTTMSFPISAVLPEIVLLAGSVVVLVFAMFAPERRQQAAAPIALVVVAATAAASVMMLGGDQTLAFADTYTTDGVAVWAKLIVLLVMAAVILLSVQWFAPDPRRGEYYALLLMSGLGAIVMAGATDFMELLLGVLLSSATGYFLAAFHRRAPRAVEAGMKYFLLGALTNGIFLYGVVLLFGLAGTTGLAAGRIAFTAADPIGLVAASGLVIIGLAFKLGAVPAHAWVPDVADGSPAPVAAFLTVAPKIGAFVAIARLAAVLPDGAGWRPVVAVIALATMTLGNLACLWQVDVRRLLGWSAVSQTGYGLLAIIAVGRSDLAVPALLYFLVAYAAANVAAFAVVVKLRGRTAIGDYDGLATAHPMLALVLVVSFLSFIGIPPLAGFTAKLALFGAAIDAGYAWLAVAAVMNTAISVFYYLRVLGPAYHATLVGPVPVLGRLTATSAILAAGIVVVAGIAADPLLRAFEAAILLPR